MKRVLITGAAGFLGSHLCDRFIKEGFHVIAMDNLITGDLKNIEHLFELEQAVPRDQPKPFLTLGLNRYVPEARF